MLMLTWSNTVFEHALADVTQHMRKDCKKKEKPKQKTVFGHLKGGFPLSHNFYVPTDVSFNWLYVNKLETMYGRSDVNVKVERGSTFTFTRGFSYIISILFTHVKPVKVYVRTHVKIVRQWKSTLKGNKKRTGGGGGV